MPEEVPEVVVVVPEVVAELVAAELEIADDAKLLTELVVLLWWTAELTRLGAPVITERTEVTTSKVKI